MNSFIGLHSAKRDYTMTRNNDNCTAEVWDISFRFHENTKVRVTAQSLHELGNLGENSHGRRFSHDGDSSSCLWPCMRHCCGGLTLAGSGVHQSHFITPFFSWTGEQEYSKRMVGGDKDMERDYSPVTTMGETDSARGNYFSLLPITFFPRNGEPSSNLSQKLSL